MVDSEGSSVQRVCARCGELIGEFGVYQLEESLRVDLHGGRDRFFFFRGGGGSCEAGGRGQGDRLRLGSCVEEWFRHIAARGSRRAHEELLEGQRSLSLCTRSSTEFRVVAVWASIACTSTPGASGLRAGHMKN